MTDNVTTVEGVRVIGYRTPSDLLAEEIAAWRVAAASAPPEHVEAVLAAAEPSLAVLLARLRAARLRLDRAISDWARDHEGD